jgi:hypothetical protein
MKAHSRNIIFSTLGIAAVWLVGVGIAASTASAPVSASAISSPVATPRPLLAIAHNRIAELGGGGQIKQLQTKPGDPAGKAFKNVTALPEISVADFMGTMGIMCASLGFDCSECHDRAGTEFVQWDADDNPRKVMARKMVHMVRAINRDNFGGRQVVTCWTCHRGRDKPLVTPTIDYIYSEPPVFADDVVVPTADAPKAEPIIAKYLAAIGGEQKWSAINSYVIKAKSEFFGGFGGAGDVQVFAQAPDKRTTIIHFPDAKERDDSTRTYNGKEGWVKTPLSVLGEYAVTGGELDGVRLDAMMGFPGNLRKALSNFRVGSPTSIDGKPMVMVQGDGPGNTLTSLYFDAQSGLLARVIRFTRSPIGRIPTQLDYSDYREVSGVKMPFKWVFAWVDGKDTIQIQDIQTNVRIDQARFERPSVAVVKK